MPRRAKYPEWVEQHLSKGIYVNKVGDKYYLYKVQKEQGQDSSSASRSNIYLGSVTEDNGFIPAKKKEALISTIDYAVPFAVDHCCQLIRKGLRTSYRKNGTLVYVCSILTFLYGTYSSEVLMKSWLSLKYPEVSIPSQLSESALSAIGRGTNMINDTVMKTYGNDWNVIRALFGSCVLVLLDGNYLLPTLSETCIHLNNKYRLNLDVAFKTIDNSN